MPRKVADVLLVALFLVGSAAYAAASLWNAVSDRAGLTAALAKWWRPLPARVEDHFTAHLAARSALVAAHSQLRVDWLGASPNPKVWLGRDGWLFLNHNADPGFLKPGDHALPGRVDRWASALSARRRWLAGRGTKMLAVAMPDKQSIYPEFVPGAGKRYGPSPLDDVLARCRRDRDLDVLDLRDPLRAAKAAGPVYLRTDTHCTVQGTYVGYAATVRALARWYPSLAPVPVDAHEVPGGRLSGDLAMLLSQTGRMVETPSVLVRPGPQRAAVTAEVPAYRKENSVGHIIPRVWAGGDPAGPRVVILGDSFANDLYSDLLAQHCPRLVRVGAYEPQEELIARERPDVVIWEFVERMVEGYSPRPPIGEPTLMAAGASAP